MNSQIISYLGPKSYPAIVNQIAEKLNTAKCNTLEANELVSNICGVLNESITPMLDLREFVTNAEPLAKHDATVNDILKFITKNVKSGDLNFLANIAKEEHFKNLTRTGFPDVKSTIDSFVESQLNEPASVIEQAIKNGIFDKLQSNLMMDLKSQLVDDGKNKIIVPETQINENTPLFNGSLISYNPIGIKMEDPKNNRFLLLTESDVLSFDRVNKEFERIPGDDLLELSIPDTHKRMMSAIQELAYNPENNSFSLTNDWDFGLSISESGKIELTKNGSSIELPKEDLKALLFESINKYFPTTQTEKRNPYLRDADNMILLVENFSKLIKIDNLTVIRNLNESNKYVIVQPESQKAPKLIAGVGLHASQLFESYSDLGNKCSELLGDKLTGLFESQLSFENEFNSSKNKTISNLLEEQSQLNESINEVDELLSIAEKESPAFVRLDEAKKEFMDKLDINLDMLSSMKQTKIYG